MAELLENLKNLQHIDGQIYAMRRQQQEKPRELEQAKQKVAEQEARVKAAEGRVKAAQLAQKDKEVELGTREGNIKKLQGQLFQLKTNKEYTAMQHEIDTIKADNSLLEEAILKLFDEIESANRDKQQEQKALAEIQAAFAAEKKRVDDDLKEIAERLAQLEQERKRVTPAIEPATLSVYDRILAARNGVAMVPITKESCGGCYRRLPPQVINRVSFKTELVTCESCNRILFLPDAGQPPV